MAKRATTIAAKAYLAGWLLAQDWPDFNGDLDLEVAVGAQYERAGRRLLRELNMTQAEARAVYSGRNAIRKGGETDNG